MSAKKRDSKRSEGTPNASETPGVWRHRAPERLLLLFVALAFLAIYAKMLALRPPSAPPLQWLDLLPALAFLTALVITHLSLLFTFSRADPVLPAITLFLSGIGLVAQLRMHSYDFANISRLSNYALPAGLMLMLATAFLCRKGRAALLGRCGWLSWAVACAVLGGILAFGRRYRGAVFLPGNINPAEVVKVLLVIFIAAYVAKHRETLRERAPVPIPSLRYLVLFGAWLAPMVLLVLQRDLGMIVLLNAVLFVVLFMATRRWSLLALTAGGAGLVVVLILTVARHGQRRIEIWIDPFRNATGAGWQVLQGLTAMYTGGLWGVGLGEGAPKYIPIASSDFIYAVIGEELGFLGCVLVVGAFVMLFSRGFRIACTRSDLFAALLTAGLTATLAVQTLLNIGGVTKAIPLTGITLPFISYGGSSLVTTFVTMGLILAMSDTEPATAPAKKQAKPKGKKGRGRARA